MTFFFPCFVLLNQAYSKPWSDTWKESSQVFLFAEDESESSWPAPPMIKYKKASKTRENLVIVMVSGLFGSLVGLSTVSFYQKPERSLSNISLGFTLGILTGALFVTYRFITHSRLKEVGKELSLSYESFFSSFDKEKRPFLENGGSEPLWLRKQKTLLFQK